jgi:hypothetical protein
LAQLESVLKFHHFNDPLYMPDTGLPAEQLFARAKPLAGTAGQDYVERRGIPVAVAAAAGLRFETDFGGRSAVLAAVRDDNDRLTAVHGRYLETVRSQNKMLTVGPGNGAISVLGGWRAHPLILVEGLFDALSLAVCGWSAVANIGRWAAWLPDVCKRRTVWLAFDATKPAEIDVVRYMERLHGANLRRLLPPERCKDWNTALRKQGAAKLSTWLQQHLTGERSVKGIVDRV